MATSSEVCVLETVENVWLNYETESRLGSCLFHEKVAIIKCDSYNCFKLLFLLTIIKVVNLCSAARLYRRQEPNEKCRNINNKEKHMVPRNLILLNILSTCFSIRLKELSNIRICGYYLFCVPFWALAWYSFHFRLYWKMWPNKRESEVDQNVKKEVWERERWRGKRNGKKLFFCCVAHLMNPKGEFK